MIDFDGRVAVVTGAGRGLGRLDALDLARRGARVVVNDLGTSVHGEIPADDVAERVVPEIVRAGGTAVGSSHDVADPEDAETELVVPLVVHLASPACEVSQHVYSAGGGRFARVFVGLGSGWFAGSDSVPSAEDIAEHFAEIEQIESHSVPTSVYDEVGEILGRHGAGAGAEESNDGG